MANNVSNLFLKKHIVCLTEPCQQENWMVSYSVFFSLSKNKSQDWASKIHGNFAKSFSIRPNQNKSLFPVARPGHLSPKSIFFFNTHLHAQICMQWVSARDESNFKVKGFLGRQSCRIFPCCLWVCSMWAQESMAPLCMECHHSSSWLSPETLFFLCQACTPCSVI